MSLYGVVRFTIHRHLHFTCSSDAKTRPDVFYCVSGHDQFFGIMLGTIVEEAINLSVSSIFDGAIRAQEAYDEYAPKWENVARQAATFAMLSAKMPFELSMVGNMIATPPRSACKETLFVTIMLGGLS